LLQSTIHLCRAADAAWISESDTNPDQLEFGMPVYGGYFNVLEYLFSLCVVNTARIEMGMYLPTSFQVVEFFRGVFVSFAALNQVLHATYPQNPTYAILYISWISIFLLQVCTRVCRVWL
jgi:hypothetical protein